MTTTSTASATTSTRPARWLLRPPGDAPVRLFCFPYSGTGASMYHAWPEQLGDIETCRLQPPARENRLREQHYGSYEALADSLADWLEPHLDRPFAFFGHCGGALPAYATAVALEQRGLPTPTRVFVSSQVAPHVGPYGRFLQMSDAELEVELAALIRAMGGQPMPELIELGLGVLRQDVDANKAYHLERPVPISGGITTIGWTDDVEIRHDTMGEWASYAPPGRHRHVTLPGEHYAFLSAPGELQDVFVRHLADDLADDPADDPADNPADPAPDHARSQR